MSSVRLVETKQEEKERKKEEKDYAPARQCKHPERQKKKSLKKFLSSPLLSLSLSLFIFSFSDFLSLSIPSVCIAHNDLSVKLDRIVDDSAVKYLEKTTGYP